MAATNSFLEKKAEQALKLYLLEQDELTAANIYEGQSNGDKSTPCVIVEASQGEEYPAYSGHYWTDVAVIVRSSASEDTGEHESLTGNVRAYLARPTLEASLNERVDLFGVSAIQFAGIQSGEVGDQYESTYRLRLLCCESNL